MASFVSGVVFECSTVESSAGFCLLRVSGNDCLEIFKDEAGGHRHQRIPPTERNGRVHTSTITVAVLDEAKPVEIEIKEEDLEWRFTKGSGAGGQKRNRTSSTVQLRHLPTGILIRCEAERSQTQNRQTALEILRDKLVKSAHNQSSADRSSNRRSQLGSGMRGDKRRTIRWQYGIVEDHITGRTWELKRYLRGDW